MMPPATIETDFRADAGVPAPWLGRLVAWTSSPAYLALADLLIVLAAAALPWSTTLPAIFVALWLPVVAPTIQRELSLTTPDAAGLCRRTLDWIEALD